MPALSTKKIFVTAPAQRAEKLMRSTFACEFQKVRAKFEALAVFFVFLSWFLSSLSCCGGCFKSLSPQFQCILFCHILCIIMKYNRVLEESW